MWPGFGPQTSGPRWGDYTRTEVDPSNEYKWELRTGLAILGIRYDTLFPDLDGLSKEFNYGFITRRSTRTRGIPSDELPR
jgi:hypothetical protein